MRTSQSYETCYAYLTSKTRQPIFDLKHLQSVAYIVWYPFSCTFFSIKNVAEIIFFIVLRCKNYLEKLKLRILWHILSFLLELPRRGRLAHDHRGRQSAVVLLSFAFFPRDHGERDRKAPNQNLGSFSPFP